MKKKLFLIFIIFFSYHLGNTQSKNEVTILYLLPFHITENFDAYRTYKNSDEIYQIKQFEMIGFWLGAKMALQEYEDSDKKINVVVRDAVTDVNALRKILDDSISMAQVNIIIGPFYGSLFPVASEFAKKHNIIIVNPFSSRYDFVENNPFVYKLVPPFSSRPETIEKTFLSQHNEYTVILWGDSSQSAEFQAYRYYFTEHNIPFREIQTLSISLNEKNRNLIIAFFDDPTKVVHSVHTLINYDTQSMVLIVPEKWFSISELTEDFFNLPYLYYFTNCFVDKNNAKAQQFQMDYLFNYEAPAELEAYSYQGYDITHYFLDLYFSNFNTNKIQFQPLSYQFHWKQIFNGGFENNKTRFIRVNNLELEEVK